IRAYRAARTAWAELAGTAEGVYARDITFGRVAHLRGHWADRLAAIDQDLADMEARKAPTRAPDSSAAPHERAEKALRAALHPPLRPQLPVEHTPPAPFHPGQPVRIELTLGPVPEDARPVSIHLRCRRIDQAEAYRELEMPSEGSRYHTVISGDYTQSPYPLQYYFTLRDARGRAWLHPGFAADLSSQPYFVV